MSLRLASHYLFILGRADGKERISLCGVCEAVWIDYGFDASQAFDSIKTDVTQNGDLVAATLTLDHTIEALEA